MALRVFSTNKRKSFRLFSDNKISSDEEFRDYAHNVMKQAHKDNYSEETTNKVVDDLLKNNPDADYGELVGRLTSGFGDREFSSTYIGHYEVQDDDGSWVPKTMTIKVDAGKNPQTVFEEKLNNLKKKGKRISSPKLTYGSY